MARLNLHVLPRDCHVFEPLPVLGIDEVVTRIQCESERSVCLGRRRVLQTPSRIIAAVHGMSDMDPTPRPRLARGNVLVLVRWLCREEANTLNTARPVRLGRGRFGTAAEQDRG